MELKFHPDVALEIRASYLWLGENFLSELESAYEAIIELPDTWPLFQKGFKRYLLSQFPFSVIYRKNGNAVYTQSTWKCGNFEFAEITRQGAVCREWLAIHNNCNAVLWFQANSKNCISK